MINCNDKRALQDSLMCTFFCLIEVYLYRTFFCLIEKRDIRYHIKRIPFNATKSTRYEVAPVFETHF